MPLLESDLNRPPVADGKNYGCDSGSDLHVVIISILIIWQAYVTIMTNDLLISNHESMAALTFSYELVTYHLYFASHAKN